MPFKIKKSTGTPLRKLADAYCSRFGLKPFQVRFTVHGERIGRRDSAEKFGLTDDESIDVVSLIRDVGSGDGWFWPGGDGGSSSDPRCYVCGVKASFEFCLMLVRRKPPQYYCHKCAPAE